MKPGPGTRTIILKTGPGNTGFFSWGVLVDRPKAQLQYICTYVPTLGSFPENTPCTRHLVAHAIHNIANSSLIPGGGGAHKVQFQIFLKASVVKSATFSARLRANVHLFSQLNSTVSKNKMKAINCGTAHTKHLCACLLRNEPSLPDNSSEQRSSR